MIMLFTDFGLTGPYVGQMKAVLAREAPGVPVINLFADAPRFAPRASAYLLAAYVEEFPLGTVFLAVVDPGVGTDKCEPMIVEVDGRWFVGPGNGLFNVIGQRAANARAMTITWRPARLSPSFHGRDLFAPMAARIARGDKVAGTPVEDWIKPWPADLMEVIYVDHFGNAMTGIRAVNAPGDTVEVNGHRLNRARTFGEVAPGEAFWYENANGLLEIAVNQGRADSVLGLCIGTPVTAGLKSD
ncbi:MAG: SAM-dependent chlorinase/fluorinase [Gammaproteobacteria bacterium]|nr:SAM-dependent chlorinase/fluorinase [Gammaproteobacteria bacterium]